MLGVVLGASLDKVNSRSAYRLWIHAFCLGRPTLGNEQTASALNLRSSRLYTSEGKYSQVRQHDHNRQSAL
jgi:hypothetical protein